MSYWTYIRGTIMVSPLGRTQEEMNYILKTVLRHLPKVSGSEKDMEIIVNQPNGWTTSASCDEFDNYVGNFEINRRYILTLYGNLRDRTFDETYKEFNKWINRLAKRVFVDEVFVNINGYNYSDSNKHHINKHNIIIDNNKYYNLYEQPTWYRNNKDGEPNWCEYLMYENAKDYRYPMMLAYKYINDEENDAEVERRIDYRKR